MELLMNLVKEADEKTPDPVFSIRFRDKREERQVFESNEIELIDEINELSIYKLTSLLVEIKENEITLSSQNAPFRLSKCNNRLMINMLLEPFHVVISGIACERNIFTDEGRAELRRLYDEQYPVQWTTYCEKEKKEMNSLFKSWTVKGNALNLRFFNLNTMPCSVFLHNMRDTSIQIANSNTYLTPNSSIEFRTA